jgi:hypothetical protein
MRAHRPERFDVQDLMVQIERASPLDAVEVLAREFARVWQAGAVSFLIADYGGDHLSRLTQVGTGRDELGERERVDTAQSVPISGTPQGQVLRTQQPLVRPAPRGAWMYAPVTSRGEAIGVLEAHLPAMPADQTQAEIAAAAHALAYVVITNRRFTDLFEWGQRAVQFDLGAEIQRRLLPSSFTCEAAQFTIAGWLEPAPRAAGDTFDYMLDRNHLHASLTDAMGHEVAASQLATLAVAALRQSRRRGATLLEQAQNAQQVMTEHSSPEQFVTGLLLRADLETGATQLINAGHPSPYLLRDGQAHVLTMEPDPPFGMFPDSEYHEHALQLRSGDRLLLVTDGMLERNAANLDICHELISTPGLHPRETVQHLIRNVGAHGELHDDAAVLCLDWHDPRQNLRDAGSGADPTRASGPA